MMRIWTADIEQASVSKKRDSFRVQPEVQRREKLPTAAQPTFLLKGELKSDAPVLVFWHPSHAWLSQIGHGHGREEKTENGLWGSRHVLELGGSQPAKLVVEAPVQLRVVLMGSGARRPGSGQAWISPGGAAGNQGAITDGEEGQCNQSVALLS